MIEICNQVVNHGDLYVVFAVPLFIGIVSGFVANCLSERSDRIKWRHAEEYFKKQTQIITMRILLSLRIFINLNNTIIEEDEAIKFIKENLIDKIENYKKKVMYPSVKNGHTLLLNLNAVKQDIESLHSQLLSFEFPNKKLLKIIEDLEEKIDFTLIPFQVFPEIIFTGNAKENDPDFARENLFLNYKELAKLSFKYRNEIK